MEQAKDRRTVLIGSCGGLTGIYLARRFSLQTDLIVMGADCNSETAFQFFASTTFHLPRADAPEFIGELISLLKRKEIDFYIPTHSVEMRIVSSNEEDLRKAAPHTHFIVSPHSTFEALDDKSHLTASLEREGIPTPRLIELENVTECDMPLFAKRNIGSGGSGCQKVEDIDLARALSGESDDVSFYEYIQGDELTIDCMFDPLGKLLAYNQRKRIKTLGGAAIITKNDFSLDVSPWIEKMSRIWTFKGCVNFQCIVRDDAPFFTDVNLRYPSGGLPLTVESGVDVPEMVIRVLSGDRLAVGEYASDRKARTMYRYFDEKFSEDR